MTPRGRKFSATRWSEELTSIDQGGGAVLVAAVAAVAGGGGVGVHHEVSLLPAVLLQRAPQLFVPPDDLEHLPGSPHLPL